jgi:hypothetical protein
MARDLVAKSYRLMADQSIRDAKNAPTDYVREAYENLAAEWLAMAIATERNKSDTRNVVSISPPE